MPFDSLLHGFSIWPQTRDKASFERAEDNWFSRYLLARWLKNRYDRRRDNSHGASYTSVHELSLVFGSFNKQEVPRTEESESEVRQGPLNNLLNASDPKALRHPGE